MQSLTARATRIHLIVSPEFVALLRRAKAGQSHVRPGTTADQVLTAALELLLAKQAKRKACQPAEVERELTRRDAGACTWPTRDGGGCGSAVRPEIDHVVTRGRGGGDSVANWRLLCDRHDQEAARAVHDAHGNRFMGSAHWRGRNRLLPRLDARPLSGDSPIRLHDACAPSRPPSSPPCSPFTARSRPRTRSPAPCPER